MTAPTPQVQQSPPMYPMAAAFGQPYMPPSVFPKFNALMPRPQAFLATTNHSFPEPWKADIGASHHGPNASQNIQQTSPFEGPDQLTLANGQSLSIVTIGSSVFKSPFSPNRKLILNDILHVPSLTHNLLSVSKFARDNSAYFQFHPDTCVVKSQGTNETLLKGTVGVDGLY